MKVPISWLEEYVKVDLNLKDLMWKMTEVGLTTEAYEKFGKDIVLDVEVTPNRPDWLSITGVAREVAAIQRKNLKLPKLPEIPKPKKKLPIKYKPDYKLIERISAVVISDVNIKPSPEWMQKRLKLVGLRPINNIVDITNYVMFELGIPMHAFDYDALDGKELKIQLSKGGEEFTSVDGISYKLPKDAMIIKDAKGKVIDLMGIKGAEIMGIKDSTKNVLLHVTIDNPVMIRKTTQSMKLTSDASYIYERGPDVGGTLKALKRAVDLIQEYADGKIASEVIDLKPKEFTPTQISVSMDKINNVLGLELKSKEVVKLLQYLDLLPEEKDEIITCTIPTFRSDITIEEDLIEEIGRMYGYDNFPLTLPEGGVNTKKIPFYYDRDWEMFLKQILIASGYSEIKTLSLISKDIVEHSQLPLDSHIKLANPVSREYEYLRTSLIPSLLMATKLNQTEDKLRLFEYSKVFPGPVETREERYCISGISKGFDFREAKGLIDLMLNKLGVFRYEIKKSTVQKSIWHPNKSAVLEVDGLIIGQFGYLNPKTIHEFGLDSDLFAFELDSENLKKIKKEVLFTSIPKYPPQVEDITVNILNETNVGDVIQAIKSASKFVSSVSLLEVYQNAYTFRIEYQHREKTLTDAQVEKIRDQIIKNLEKKHNLKVEG